MQFFFKFNCIEMAKNSHAKFFFPSEKAKGGKKAKL